MYYNRQSRLPSSYSAKEVSTLLESIDLGNPCGIRDYAIINYLKNARPKAESDHVFIRQVPPYTDFRPGDVGALVRVHLQKSGIHIESIKKGSHTLRHSLASRLLEHEIPLPVISEILGHTNTEITMTYLRIDIAELRKCALEVAI